MVMSGFFSDAIDYLIDFQFSVAQRHDIQVVFRETSSPQHSTRSAKSAGRLPSGAVSLRGGEPAQRPPELSNESSRFGRTRQLYRLLNVQCQAHSLAGIWNCFER